MLQHAAWLGPLFCAALLRQDGVAAHHLAALHLGAKSIPRERRRARKRDDRLLAFVDTFREAALAGLKKRYRLTLAKVGGAPANDAAGSPKLPGRLDVVLGA